MKLIRGSINRLLFLPVKAKLRKCGSHTLFESPYEIEGERYISVGSNVRTKPRFHIAAISTINHQSFVPEILIGNNVSINYDVHIACINRVEIQEGVLLASKVFITDHFHGDTSLESMLIPPSNRELYSKGGVIIEKNVWIGEGVTILPGVTVGRNAIIGANSVVTHSIPPFSVAAGNPAKVIKQYPAGTQKDE